MFMQHHVRSACRVRLPHAETISTSRHRRQSDASPLHAICRFAFIFLVLVIVAGWTSTTKCKVASLLNRQQTEEWKGWMQVGPAADE